MDEKYLKQAHAETFIEKDELEEIKKTLGAPKDQQDSDFDRWMKDELMRRIASFLKDKIQLKQEDAGDLIKFSASFWWYDLQQEIKDNEQRHKDA